MQPETHTAILNFIRTDTIIAQPSPFLSGAWPLVPKSPPPFCSAGAPFRSAIAVSPRLARAGPGPGSESTASHWQDAAE
jgi:hypothetical protein